MKKRVKFTLFTAIALLFLLPYAKAETAAELQLRSEKELHHLYAKNPKAREIGDKAIAILVFPSVYKAGFLIGAQTGNGVLLRMEALPGTITRPPPPMVFRQGFRSFLTPSFSWMKNHFITSIRAGDVKSVPPPAS